MQTKAFRMSQEDSSQKYSALHAFMYVPPLMSSLNEFSQISQSMPDVTDFLIERVS